MALPPVADVGAAGVDPGAQRGIRGRIAQGADERCKTFGNRDCIRAGQAQDQRVHIVENPQRRGNDRPVQRQRLTDGT